MLTQEFLKSILHYNQLSGAFTWIDSRHNAVRVGCLAGYIKTDRAGKKYRCIGILGKEYRLHQLAFLYVNGILPNIHVDHIDHNSLNNSWLNLREVTNQENSRNQKIPKNNKSGVIGVFWHSSRKKWTAEINCNEGKKHLGYFVEKEDAVKVRREANIKYDYHPNHGIEQPL